MSFYEIIIAILAVLITSCLYTMVIEKDNYNMGKLLILFLGICPIVLFSINMVWDTITADEYQYMNVIVDMSNILEQPVVAAKLMLQYRTSQMIFGTIFKIIPKVFYNSLSKTNLIIMYKLLHWILYYVVGVSICTVIYKKYLLHNSEKIYKKIMAWLVTFYMVLGLPMTISVMKVCNYDATNVMFAALGLVLVGTYVIDALGKKDSGEKYALLGVICCVLGCLDKWSSAIYFIICMILYCFADVVKKKDINFLVLVRTVLISSIKILLLALVCGWANLQYISIFLADGTLYGDITFAHVAFSYTNLFPIMFSGEASAQINENVVLYVVLLCVLIMFCTIITYVVFWWVTKYRYLMGKIINIIAGLVILMLVTLGIYGSYFVPQRMHPFDLLKEGEISSSVLWGVYHYGAFTMLGHRVMQCIYAFATVLGNLPTGVSVMLLVGSVVFLRRSGCFELKYSFVAIACVVVIVILACMDQPSDPRYFGVSILCIVFSVWVAVYNEWEYLTISKKSATVLLAITLGGITWNMELALYQPNVKIFAPMWLVRSTEFNKNVRLGQWYVGEAMSWGEELALAGKKINILVGHNEIENVTIYSNYGIMWLKNPGYVLKRLGEVDEFTKFDSTSYFVLTKKALFRMTELPLFITEVEPVTTVKYRGEICSWI